MRNHGLVTRAEYERRIAEFRLRLRQRERSALGVVVPAFVAGTAAVLVLSRFASKAVVLSVGLAWLGILAASALWVAVRAWRLDRTVGVVLPCPGCGKELATRAEAVMREGKCSACDAQVISNPREN